MAIDTPFSEWFLDRGLVDLTSRTPRGNFLQPNERVLSHAWASLRARIHRCRARLARIMSAPWSMAGERCSSRSRRSPSTRLSRLRGRDPGHDCGGWAGTYSSRPRLSVSVIPKHNRAGKGLGVRLFYSDAALKESASDAFEDSVDGITLVQRYIKAPEPFITRVEFIGGSCSTPSGWTPPWASSSALPTPARLSSQ